MKLKINSKTINRIKNDSCIEEESIKYLKSIISEEAKKGKQAQNIELICDCFEKIDLIRSENQS